MAKFSSAEAHIEAKWRIESARLGLEEHLDLSIPGLVQIPSLHNLSTVRSLSLLQTDVSDIDQISSLKNLRSLTVNYGPALDLLPISKLSELQFLDLTGTKISDLSPLSHLKRLQTLDLVETQITDVAPLSNLTSLQRLYLSYTRVADITPLSRLKSLQRLSLSRTEVLDLSPLKDLPALHLLYLKGAAISEFGQLADLQALRSLNLFDTRISSLEPLTKISLLQFINLTNTSIRNLDPAMRMSALRSLNIENTAVEDISPLAKSITLQTLNISNTNISDLAPLADLIGLIDGAVAFKHGGLTFTADHLGDASLRTFARLKNPERTIKTIEYLRKNARLPRYVPPSARLLAISRAIENRQKPIFGTYEETHARSESVRSISDLEIELTRYRNAPPPIGHNHPPSPIPASDELDTTLPPVFSDEDLKVLDRLVTDLKTQLAASRPKVDSVFDATKKLGAIQERLVRSSNSRWETAKDKFVEGFADEAGRGLAKALTWALCGAIGTSFLALLAWLYSIFTV